jgi:thioredoxin-dependent peroxiredoxin
MKAFVHFLVLAVVVNYAFSAEAQTENNAHAEIIVGDTLPAFTLEDDRGESWHSVEHVGKKVVVLYFYPGDFTGGCNKQLRAYRDHLARLEELDIELVGISGDHVATHQLYKSTHDLKHTLLADSDGCLACTLGMPRQPGAKVRARNLDGKVIVTDNGRSLFLERNVTLPRWTLVINRDGKLISKRTDVDPATDVDEVIKVVEGLAK